MLKKNILQKKSLSVNTLNLFFPQNVLIFFIIFIKNAFPTNSRLFSQKYACNEKDKNVWLQGLQIAVFQQSFFQCWWKCPFLEGSLIQKPT